MSTREIAKDLGHHLQQQIGQVLGSQLATAQHVLPAHEVCVIFMEAAVAVTISAAATLAASAEDRSRRPELFDLALRSIADLAGKERERSLGEIAKRFGEAA